MTAQRPKPAYDPETKEGLLIQHIQQETDPAEKLHYMEQFSLQYPANAAILWVYDQLQLAYLKEKAWDETMRIGEKRVALEPLNLDAAKLSLKAAESKANLYAESSLYTIAEQTPDPATRLELLLALLQRNPNSPFAANLPAECVALYKKLNQMDKALALANQTLATDPDNIDLLMAVAEYYFSREDHPKVIANTVHVIEVVEKKPRPDSMSEDEWQKKRTQVLGSARYMGGVSCSLSGQYGRGDQMLRAAIPFVAGDATQEATVFYFLGLANYKLADKAPARAQDAIRFWRRCALVKSTFQAQALKNVDATRNEFNLP
jgi:tetratricopeptide (TPR) repeat protein